MEARPEFASILETLARHEVDHILVGGVAAVLEGAPVSTFDTDVLVERSPANLQRLLDALGEMDAMYRDPAGRRIPPSLDRLESLGHQRLVTHHGFLDVLGTIGSGRTYEDLLPRSHPTTVRGREVRVLDLEAVIQSKEEAGRERDHADLPRLRETLRLKTERAKE